MWYCSCRALCIGKSSSVLATCSSRRNQQLVRPPSMQPHQLLSASMHVTISWTLACDHSAEVCLHLLVGRMCLQDVAVPISEPTPGANKFAVDTSSTLQCTFGPGLPNNRLIIKKTRTAILVSPLACCAFQLPLLSIH